MAKSDPVQVSVHMPRAMRARLNALAKARKLNLSATARLLLQEAMDSAEERRWMAQACTILDEDGREAVGAQVVDRQGRPVWEPKRADR